MTTSETSQGLQQSGAEEACWAHNPEVGGSKPPSATYKFSDPFEFIVDRSMWYDSKIPVGPVRESNPGPRAPEARIIPLDQQAIAVKLITKGPKYGSEQLHNGFS